MLSFIRRRILKEHMKLVAQNHSALSYCSAFMSAGQLNSARSVMASVQSGWVPGQRLTYDQARTMFDLNKTLRRVYDDSPSAAAGMRRFDDQFVPLLGWDEYFSRYLTR